MFGSEHEAANVANGRVNQKLNKGYATTAPGWMDLDPNGISGVLSLAGVNTRAAVPVPEGEGVTFEEMATLVDDVLKKSTGVEKPDVEVLVEAAQMNAKFATLREQFEQVESTVEFVNTAVRSRM
jgi:arabinogalactan endo-1,4-beta-galactosidase